MNRFKHTDERNLIMGNVMKKVVAVVGMCGSGKSEITNMFIRDGYKKIYFGDVTLREVKRNGLEVNEKNEKATRESLRAEHGKSAYAKILLPDITEAMKETDVVLDGMYSWSEYKYLKDNLDTELVILAVVTNRSVRQARLKNRPIRPLDQKNAEARDIAEIENIEKGGPIAFADYYVMNNDSLENLSKQYEEFKAWLG